MQWPETTIESIRSKERCSLVGGPFGSNLTTRDYVDEGVPVIRGGNLPEDSKFLDDDFVFVSEEKADQLAANLAFSGDVVFTQRGTLGQVGLIPDGCAHQRYVLSQSQMKLTVDRSKADPTYVYYFFRQSETVQYIRNHDSSSGVPHINLAVLKAMRLPLPPLGDQQRIVETIGAYDDLIDNNRRRIKLLEDSVRLLFDEWFVRQQLPPHLESRSDDEPQHFSVADLCVEVKNQVLPEAIDADTPYIGLEHMPRRSITLSDWGAADDVTSAKLCYVEGDIIFGKIRPYFHKVGIALTDGVCSSDAIVMRPRAERWRPLLLALVSSDAFIAATAQGMKEGSKMPRADWKQMRAYSVCVPNPQVLSAFNSVAEPVLQQVKTLALQARALRTARDLLLPRLMSGELTA
jgi:type I restriction enzyme, S subunit